MNSFAQKRMRKVLGMLQELQERARNSPLDWSMSAQMGDDSYYGTGEFDGRPVAVYEICSFADSSSNRLFVFVRNPETGEKAIQLTRPEEPVTDVIAAQKICDEHWLATLEELKSRRLEE